MICFSSKVWRNYVYNTWFQVAVRSRADQQSFARKMSKLCHDLGVLIVLRALFIGFCSKLSTAKQQGQAREMTELCRFNAEQRSRGRNGGIHFAKNNLLFYFWKDQNGIFKVLLKKESEMQLIENTFRRLVIDEESTNSQHLVSSFHFVEHEIPDWDLWQLWKTREPLSNLALLKVAWI